MLEIVAAKTQPMSRVKKSFFIVKFTIESNQRRMYMSFFDRKIGKILGVSAALIGSAFIGLTAVAKKTKADSVYENEPEQKNQLEGKRVVFVSDENDKENADGVKGHLEAVENSNYSPNFYEKYIKRGMDAVLSFGGLVVLSPVMGAIALAIKVEDPGPVLFTQKRMGQNKQYFKLHKFRSMRLDTPHDVPTHQLENPEQYITKVGKFIRAHSLDELPQIWDIFVGNMSVIGPRPGLWNQDLLTAERDKYGANDVKPGLTGLAQINGRDELEIEEKAKLDGEYVKNLSFAFDVKCFLDSVLSVIKTDGVVEGGTGELKKEKTRKKKILVICQYYKPEPFRVSDICEELVRRGNEVHVVTGYPNYPEGNIYSGYGKGKKIDEEINGVKIHRCFTVPRKTGAVKRLLNYYSYSISSTIYSVSKKCVANDGKPFDVVFCNQLSPVMMAEAAIMYKKKYNVPVVMYCLDLWPESLIAGGVTRNSLIYKIFYDISKRIYTQMDKILVTSKPFITYFNNEFGVEKAKIKYLPQYAEDIFKELPLKKQSDICDLVFAGNIGSAQSVETIIKAAEILKDEPIKFHIVGGGTDLNRIKELAKNLDNVVFYGRKSVDEMPEFYANADAMLITLEADPFLSMTLPGKIQSYMAAGKPIIGSADGATKEIIEVAQCGFCGRAENEFELAESIKKFIEFENKALLGENSRKYYMNNFQKNVFMDKLENEL